MSEEVVGLIGNKPMVKFLRFYQKKVKMILSCSDPPHLEYIYVCFNVH